MNKKALMLGLLVTVLAGTVAPAMSLVTQAAPLGTLTAQCVGNAVYLEWGSHPQANSNGLQKADSFPSDPNAYWDWLPTSDTQRSYMDYNVVAGRTYQYRVKYQPQLPSNIVTIACPVPTPTPIPTPTWTPAPTPMPIPRLDCAPSVQWAQSGDRVNFSATYQYLMPYASTLRWTAVGGSPSSGTGYSFGTRFHTSSINETRVVSVTDGYQTANCTVFVYGPTPTWTPTPAPVPMLQCSPSYSSAASGERVYMSVWGGNGSYSWSANHGSPDDGRGQNFSTRFYNYGTSGLTRSVTVTSGHQRTTCTVYVYGTQPTPTPYPTWTPVPTPTWTPIATPVPGTLVMSKTGRNVTRGQTGDYATVNARASDTIEFVLHIRSGSYLNNVYVTDYLPAGMRYIAGSTVLNSYIVADGITSSGLNIGPLAAGQEAVIRFSVLVDGSAVPSLGQVTVSNTAQARADGVTLVSATMKVTFGQAPLASAYGVATGPADSLLLALAAAILATGIYAGYTRTGSFKRRMAVNEIGKMRGTIPNFLG